MTIAILLHQFVGQHHVHYFASSLIKSLVAILITLAISRVFGFGPMFSSTLFLMVFVIPISHLLFGVVFEGTQTWYRVCDVVTMLLSAKLFFLVFAYQQMKLSISILQFWKDRRSPTYLNQKMFVEMMSGFLLETQYTQVDMTGEYVLDKEFVGQYFDMCKQAASEYTADKGENIMETFIKDMVVYETFYSTLLELSKLEHNKVNLEKIDRVLHSPDAEERFKDNLPVLRAKRWQWVKDDSRNKERFTELQSKGASLLNYLYKKPNAV
jgi:hypothetical protein